MTSCLRDGVLEATPPRQENTIEEKRVLVLLVAFQSMFFMDCLLMTRRP